MGIDHTRLHNTFAYRSSHTQVKYKYGNEIEKRGKHYGLTRLEYTSRHDSSDGIGSIMKTIHEIESQRQSDQQNNHPN